MNATTLQEDTALPRIKATPTDTAKFEMLPLGRLQAGLNPRKSFDVAKMAELTESIRMRGVMQPILVRPHPTSLGWQIVAGERRVRASRAAGLEVIPAMVRELDDATALKLALTENLQKADLDQLEEAEGYHALMHEPHNLTVDQVAEEIGKSRSYIYSRVRLMALGAAAREAFREGRIDTSRALLIARVPGEKLQADALKLALTNWGGDQVMPYRELFNRLRNNYMVPISSAAWSPKDAALVPKAGACTVCPKLSANQRELFDDLEKGVDVCTDPPCFRAKTAAHNEHRLAEARQKGETIIEGAAARKIFPGGPDHHHTGTGYKRTSEQVYTDEGGTVPIKRILKGEEAPKTALVSIDGALIEVVAEKDLQHAMLKQGLTKKKETPPSQLADDRERLRKAEHDAREAAWTQARQNLLANYDAAAKHINVDDANVLISTQYLRLAATVLFEQLVMYNSPETVIRLWKGRLESPATAVLPPSEPDGKKGTAKQAKKAGAPMSEHDETEHYIGELRKVIPTLSPAWLLLLVSDLLMEHTISDYLHTPDPSAGGGDKLSEMCALMGVDLSKVRADRAAAEAKALQAAKAKKEPKAAKGGTKVTPLIHEG